jgi:hypothetical protein
VELKYNNLIAILACNEYLDKTDISSKDGWNWIWKMMLENMAHPSKNTCKECLRIPQIPRVWI